LPGLHNFAAARQLKKNGVGFDLIAGTCCADAEIEIGISEYFLRFKPVFADDVRDFYFRTAKGQINSADYPKKKRDRNHDYDRDSSNNREQIGY